MRYHLTADEPGAWAGEFDVRDAVLELPGFSEPLRLASGQVAVNDKRFSVTRMRGRIGQVKFTGDYRNETTKADRFKLEVVEAEIGELERLLMPALRRKQTLLSRFSLRTPPVPEWLRERKLDGTLAIEKLTAADQTWEVTRSRVESNGTNLRISGIEAHHGESGAEAQITADLSGSLPRYRLAGKVSGIEYKNGHLDIDGTVESRGLDLDVVANAHGEGTFEGETLLLLRIWSSRRFPAPSSG